ncbi:MAG TPA: chemotaxis response regulator protein-glutamate methylesterase [Gallionella sp.]|jgi:two-component system chemotaxis response regulator CheB|nr:chemotaxis response regulator protein-glutamate methylesterase [Gallionella sp.]HCI53353.1 chemotaxis response regulator protein-glutamate methylesterase [Gallionella sp.]
MMQNEVGSRKIKVLIVDDSALIRSILKEVINSQPDMEAVGAAANPLQAREMIKTLNPDVLTLDVEMPEMDGLVFLEKLMRLRPMPVLMISTLTERGSQAALRALELGAVDFLAKPKLGVVEGMNAYASEISGKIRIASRAKVKNRVAASPTESSLPTLGCRISSTEKLIIVGSSTGGTEALKEFLVPMPADAPAILVAQHMPEAFTKSFADRLNSLCKMTVTEAVHNERVLPGHVYIAPGHSHMLIKRSGSNYVIELNQTSPVNHHRPSVEVLFRSAAVCVGANAIGVMLTGMGKDGAVGMLEMREAGAYNFTQDEATCVVYGMPRAAVENGASHEAVPIGEMARRVLARVMSGGVRNRL